MSRYFTSERIQVHELRIDHALDKAGHVGTGLGVDEQLDGVEPALDDRLAATRESQRLLAVVVLAAVDDDEQMLGGNAARRGRDSCRSGTQSVGRCGCCGAECGTGRETSTATDCDGAFVTSQVFLAHLADPIDLEEQATAAVALAARHLELLQIGRELEELLLCRLAIVEAFSESSRR